MNHPARQSHARVFRSRTRPGPNLRRGACFEWPILQQPLRIWGLTPLFARGGYPLSRKFGANMMHTIDRFDAQAKRWIQLCRGEAGPRNEKVDPGLQV